MSKTIGIILKNALEKIKPNLYELKDINQTTKNFIDKIEKTRKKLKIDADIFVGGSFAKNTLIKKDYYDIDIFIRFGKKHQNEILSELTEKMLSGFVKERIHGSRDYFRIKINKNVFFEIVPVKKIKNQKESENVTDLSYFHVNYVKRKLKGKTLDEVRLAKAFCHATGCYGAESYIKGFSGYALELLIYNYGSFLNFVKAMAKVKDKLVIDTEKQYKNKNIVLMDLNAAKLQSPIVLIDPTHKQRNVLAALSGETFKKFQKACMHLLRNPGEKSFERHEIDFGGMARKAKKKRYEFCLLEAMTSRQEGDIAGSKLLKFYNHLSDEISRYFEIKEKGFEYGGSKKAKFAFIAKSKGEILAKGPKTDDKENTKRFKARHKKTFTKNGRIYAKEKANVTLGQFIKTWEKENKKIMKEMYITGFRILN